MAALVPFIAFAAGVAAQAQQNITFIPPQSIPQCGNVNFQWSGGHPPYQVTVGTTDNATVSSVLFAPNIAVHNYTYGPIDLPVGTTFTLTVRDGDNRMESPVLTVQNSGNSSCIEETTSPSSADATDSTSAETSTPSATGIGPLASQTNTPNAKSSSNSRIAIIASAVAGSIGLLAIILIVLLVIQKRRERKKITSSKEAFVRTFGPGKADLDSEAGGDVEDNALPDPYVYRNVSRSQSALAIETEDLSRGPSSSRLDPAGSSTPPQSRRSPATPSDRNPKGERYMPNYGNTPQPGGSGGSHSGMHDEDIDKLAARMVAMMSSGRLGEQAWAPERRASAGPPPLYKDVTRGAREDHSDGHPETWGGR